MSTPRVGFDASHLWFEHEGQRTQISWHDLCQVSIQTNELGPFFDDVLFVLTGSQTRLTCPQNAIGAEDLLGQLQQLPGFDNDAVISAMTSTSNQTFLCWQRDADVK